jgi:methionine-rich copper-binding protein CopC
MPHMRRPVLCAALVLLLSSSVVQAHAHLTRSVPADGSVLHGSPAQLTLTFSESAQLTALWVESADGPRQKLTPLPAAAAAEITVPLPPLKPGSYLLTWRVVGHDGHMVPGQLHFTLLE